MKKSLLTLLTAAVSSLPCVAQQVYLRVPGTNFCNVTAATNTTPIRLTVDVNCGLTNGATIVVVDVRGNTAANVHLDNPGDLANLARKVANLSGTSFDLTDLNGNPVAGAVHPSCSGAPTTHMGTCAYTGGGRVGLASAHAVRAHPIINFDGPAGPRTLAMWDPLNKANSSNPSYTRVLSDAAGYVANYAERWGFEAVNAQFRGAPTISSALAWKLTGNTGARDAALFGMRNPDQLLGSTACDETDKDCLLAANSLAAFPMYGASSYYNAYTLMHGEMTPAERAHFVEFFLADLPWSQAGVNYTGVSLIKPLLKPTTGAITATSGGNTMTGTGTAFTTQVVVGDFIILPGDSYAKPYLITSIESDTALTVSAPIASATGPGALINSNWQAAPRWDETMYGFLWNQKHFIYTPINGAGEAPPGSPYPIASPYLGAYSGFYQVGDHNHSIERGASQFMAGMVTCPDDPRGCLLATMAYEWMNDRALPYALAIWTGFSASNAVYHMQNTTGRILQWVHWTKNSVENAPDALAGTNIREQLALWMPFASVPNGGPLLPVAEPALIYPAADRMASALIAMADDKTAIHSRQFQWWLKNVLWYWPGGSNFYSYGPEAIGYASGGWAWEHFVLYEPTTVDLPIAETSHLFTAANDALCRSVYGANCPPGDDIRRVGISRSDWTDSSTYVGVNATGFGCREHCSSDLGGHFSIFKNRRPLLSTDTSALLGSRAQRGHLEIGSANNYYFGDPPIGTPTPWLSVSNNYFFMRSELTRIYTPAATVNKVERQTFHLKQGSADYVIDHVAASLAAPQTVRGWQHYNLDECGTPASTPCASINRVARTAVHTQPDTRLSSRVFPVLGNVAIGTETGVETDGSYAAGAGASFRWHVCPSVNGVDCAPLATEAEWFVVHQPSSNTGATLPPMSYGVDGSFRHVEILDPVSPKFLAFTAYGVTGLDLSFTTTHTGTGQYFITGLTPGAYDVRRNGTLIVSSRPVMSGEHSLNFESLSGAIVVTWRSPLALVTTALPNAVLGQPYAGLIEATSAAGPPYTWEISSGTLCAGLAPIVAPDTVSASVTGQAQALETCTFTVAVHTGGNQETATRQFTFTVVEPNPVPLAIQTAVLPAGRIGDQYRTAIRATGGTAPVRWSVTGGQLCTGLAVDPATGLISGTPAGLAGCEFTLRATDLGNQFQERSFYIILIEDKQNILAFTGVEASHSAAVLRFGRRGLAADQPCTGQVRLTDENGALLQSFTSAQGWSRREIAVTGLPGGLPFHAAVACGAETAAASFETALTPESATPVFFWLAPPALSAGPPADVIISYGDTVAMPDAVVASCSPTSCSALIGTPSPLLYWRARYRNALGEILAESAIRVKAPR